MARPKVFMTRPYHPEAAALLERHFDVEAWEQGDVSPPKPMLMERAADCDAFFTESYDRLDGDVFGAAKALKVVGQRSVGTDNLDIRAATNRGILLGNTPGVLHESCADLTFALMLDVARRIAYSDREVRAGRWTVLTQTPYIGTDVHGQTLGIVGLGLIGQAVARRARGFDMRVVYHSRTRKPDAEAQHGLEWLGDLPSLLRESDFVSLHMPLTSETEGLIGDAELGQMKREAFLINTTRGRTVDLKALYRALVDGTIAGAGLDVTDPEPIPSDHPLLSLPNLVITPHIASASSATFKTMARMAAENIIAALMGQPMASCINPEALDNR